MKTKIQQLALIALAIIGLIAFIEVTFQVPAKDIFVDNTRDVEYERYCDSIYFNDVDYYNDVLVETDEYQDYIDEHREWWIY